MNIKTFYNSYKLFKVSNKFQITFKFIIINYIKFATISSIIIKKETSFQIYLFLFQSSLNAEF